FLACLLEVLLARFLTVKAFGKVYQFHSTYILMAANIHFFWVRYGLSYKKILPLKIDDAQFGSGIGFLLAGINYQEYFLNPVLALETLVKDILDIKKNLSDEEALQDIIEVARSAYKAIQKQVSILEKMYRRLSDIGVREKQCPVCSASSQIDQKYCECCGFFFPLMYGIAKETEIDRTYLSIMKGLWSSSPAEDLSQIKQNVQEESPTNADTAQTETPYINTKSQKGKGVFNVNGVQFKMIPVSGGSYAMGDQNHAHKVTISGFKIGETPVTQALWRAVMGDNPSRFKGENRPVEQVSWNDCQHFIDKLNEMTGKSFRLPTEAEWEFAARGGSRSINTLYSGGDVLEEVAWFNQNCSDNENSNMNVGTHDVKAKAPNELRIYDMSGNVWEWCADWFAEYTLHHEMNPSGPSSGRGKVCRSGCWNSASQCCEVSFRNYGGLLKRDYGYGFRLAL
ncbi:MAG: formylglycine-generating enzyme family protein, partial [Bacteroidales bacterium]|nr:formylglycine-generating enzyme family protein [Bacteroidales bacterium]